MIQTLGKYLPLLRRLKPIDWTVILIASGLVVFLTVTSVNKYRWVTVTFKIQITPSSISLNGEIPPYWISERIKSGDIQYDSTGQPVLKVAAVRSWGTIRQDTYVTASVKARYKRREKKYTFLYQPLEIGRSVDLAVNGTSIHGLVTAIEGFSDTRPSYDIVIKTRLMDYNALAFSYITRGVEPWIADAVTKGQTMRDSGGTVVAEVLDKTDKPAERVVTTADGRVYAGEDPFKRDVYLTLKIKVIRQNDTYIFMEDKPIKVGYDFPLYLDRVVLSPTVIQILTQ